VATTLRGETKLLFCQKMEVAVTASPVVLKLASAGFDVRQLATLPKFRLSKGVGELIHPRQPYCILFGCASAGIKVSGARRQELEFYMPGDMLGVASLPAPPDAAIYSLGDITAVALPSSIVDDPLFERLIRSETEAKRRRFFRHLVRVGRLSSIERIADLLLEIHARWQAVHPDHQGPVPVHLTQMYVADFLAISAVHVNRCFQALRKSHVVSINTRGLEIRDPVSLQAYASGRIGQKGATGELLSASTLS